jgi:Armadillo/beta-catenin-like repeat
MDRCGFKLRAAVLSLREISCGGCGLGDQTKQALPTLARLIHSNDEEVLTDACWALSYLSDGTNDKIQEVITAGVCRRLVELLM